MKVVISITSSLFLCILQTNIAQAASNTAQETQQYCAFCDQNVLDRQTFYEDKLVYALYTHKPIYPGHCLIIPKRHVERFEELSKEEIEQIGLVIQKVHAAVTQIFDTSAYLLLQKNGYEVGQTVPHVHFHYIPRQSGDDSTIAFLFKMQIVNLLSPISKQEMQRNVSLLQHEMALQEVLNNSKNSR